MVKDDLNDYWVHSERYIYICAHMVDLGLAAQQRPRARVICHGGHRRAHLYQKSQTWHPLKWDILVTVYMLLSCSSLGFHWKKHKVVVSNIFYLHPYLGKWSNLTNFFQMGWNHQLEQLGPFFTSVFELHFLSFFTTGAWPRGAAKHFPTMSWVVKVFWR